MPSECQTVWIQIRPDILSGLKNVGPDLGPNCLQRLSVDGTIKQRVKVGVVFRKVQLPEDVASLFITLVMH